MCSWRNELIIIDTRNNGMNNIKAVRHIFSIHWTLLYQMKHLLLVSYSHLKVSIGQVNIFHLFDPMKPSFATPMKHNVDCKSNKYLYGALMEWYRKGKPQILWEIPVPLQFYLPQISFELTASQASQNITLPKQPY